MMGLGQGFVLLAEGSRQVRGTVAAPRVKVSPDARGVVPHAGLGLREWAVLSGLSARVTSASAEHTGVGGLSDLLLHRQRLSSAG